jgi:hypothetical protein
MPSWMVLEIKEKVVWERAFVIGFYSNSARCFVDD